MGGGGDGLRASDGRGGEGGRLLNAAGHHHRHGSDDGEDEGSATTAQPQTRPSSPMPAPAAGSDVVGRPKPGPKQQHKQQPESPARQPPRSIYQGKERIPFWDAPLLVAVAANLVWPAVLLLLTGWSMLVVLYFRLERLVWATVLRRPSGAEYEGEDDAPVDVGLYWFGYGNHCERHAHEPSGGTAPHRYFDPRKPSVIYVHGFARRTTARCFRETFNWAHNDAAYGLDVNAADAWLDAGWNVGIFYWNQLADEEMPQDTESKIWTSNGRTGMRYRTICPKKGTPAFYTPKAPAPSISQQLADVLAQVFRGSQAGYRLVGHSLGTQLVVHASTLLMQRQAREAEAAAATAVDGDGGAARVVLPTRIALLDVFGTLGIKAYLSGWPIMAVLQRELGALRARGVVLEQYQSSLIGRRGLWFRHLTAFIQLDPAHIPWWRLKSRHIAAIYLYFLSFGHALQGPRPKKADLRRHQSAQIALLRRAPSTAAAATAVVGVEEEGADDGDDAGTLNLDLADLLAASHRSGGHADGVVGVGGSNSGGWWEGLVKGEEEAGACDGGDAELEAAAAAAGAAALRRSTSGLSSSLSPLGDSSSSSRRDGGGKKGRRLPFGATITRIIRRGRRRGRPSSSSSASASASPSPSTSLSLSLSLSSSSHSGRAGSRSSGRLAAVSEEAVTSTTVTMVVEQHSEAEKGGGGGSGGGIATTESGVTTTTTTVITTTASFTTTSSTALCCGAGQQPPAAAAAAAPSPIPSSLCCHQQHYYFAPYTAPAESRNHVRWLLRLTKVGESYREVEVGHFPLMARATDAEIRELMECGYVYKQHNGHLFLRVSRAW